MSKEYMWLGGELIGSTDNYTAYGPGNSYIGRYDPRSNKTYSGIISNQFCEGNGLTLLVMDNWNKTQMKKLNKKLGIKSKGNTSIGDRLFGYMFVIFVFYCLINAIFH